MIVKLLLVGALSLAGSAPTQETVEKRVRELASAYAADPARVDATFGVAVGDDLFTISSSNAGVSVAARAPAVPTYIFRTDPPTFEAITQGRMAAPTAMGQARASDPTPMKIDFMPGFTADAGTRGRILSTMFHFWNDKTPEVTSFGYEFSRQVHGGQAVVLHYEPGVRSAWYGILPGQRINEDPADQTNDFPSIFMILEGGTASAQIGDKEFPLQTETSIFVPAGVRHRFWNDGDKPAKMIMVAFGPKA